MTLRHFRDVDDCAECPPVCLHGAGAQFEVPHAALGIEDDLIEVAGFTGLHHMLEDLVHVRAVLRWREILDGSANPGLRLNAAEGPIEKDAAPLPVEQGQPVGRARGHRLQGHL